MLFDTLSLECFLAVVEAGSFTRAAAKVKRTQSAVSQQIIKLENQLGSPLFLRGKKLILTPEGEILLTYAKRIILLNREALDRFKQPGLEGEVRFGLPEDFAAVFLSDVLTEYSSLHPLIMLNIECDLTLNLLDRFKNKEFDLVLLKMSRPEDFPNGINVWSEDLFWVQSRDFIGWKEDQPIPLVLSPHPCVYRSRAIESLEKCQKKWRIVFTSDSYAGKVAAVAAGMGITVLPRNMVPKHLCEVKKSKKLPKLADTHASLLKHNNENLAVNSFESFVIQHFQK